MSTTTASSTSAKPESPGSASSPSKRKSLYCQSKDEVNRSFPEKWMEMSISRFFLFGNTRAVHIVVQVSDDMIFSFGSRATSFLLFSVRPNLAGPKVQWAVSGYFFGLLVSPELLNYYFVDFVHY